MPEAIPVQTITNALKGAPAGTTGSGVSEGDWLDKLNKVLSNVDSILGKSDRLGGIMQGLIKRKEGIESSALNPVRQQKLTERETGNARAYAQVKEAASTPETVYKVREMTKEEIMARINKQFYVELVPDLIEAIDEKIPEEYKKKSIKEIFDLYRNSGNFIKSQIGNMFGSELYQIVEASVDAKNESKTPEKESAKDTRA